MAGDDRRGGAMSDMVERVAKAIVNSPLVKTAVHGADPNWGRVAMAVGKSTTAAEVDQDTVVIRFGTQEVYPALLDETGLAALSEYMRGDDVLIHVTLAAPDGSQVAALASVRLALPASSVTSSNSLPTKL